MRVDGLPSLSVLALAMFAVPASAQLEVPREARSLDLGPLPERTAAVVGPPLFRVGWDGNHNFGYVGSGVILPDGSAAVLDLMEYRLVILDPEGQVRHVLGRRGEGPGEFKYPLTVTRKGADTLVVEDDGNGRFTYFRGGELAGDERYGSREMFINYWARLWHGGAVYWTRWATPSPRPADFTHKAVLRSPSAAGPLDTLVTYRVFRDGPPSLSNPFRANGRVGLTHGAAIAVWSNEPGFVRFPFDGGTPLCVSWEEASPPLTDSLWEEHVAYERSVAGGRNADLRIGRRSNVVGPLPLLGEVRGDPLGRVWIARWGPADSFSNGTAGPYRVFSADGRWLGWVGLPTRLRVLDIGRDRILAVQRDAFDVEAVVMLPLLPPTGGP